MAETADDLRIVLARALYPVQLLAYCWLEVAADPGFRAIAEAWSARNTPLLSDLEDRHRDALPDAATRLADEERALADIEAAVAASPDPLAYCRFHARLIEGGAFDPDQREDLRAPLKRLLSAD